MSGGRGGPLSEGGGGKVVVVVVVVVVGRAGGEGGRRMEWVVEEGAWEGCMVMKGGTQMQGGYPWCKSRSRCRILREEGEREWRGKA